MKVWLFARHVPAVLQNLIFVSALKTKVVICYVS